jgi:hypothetical protein
MATSPLAGRRDSDGADRFAVYRQPGRVGIRLGHRCFRQPLPPGSDRQSLYAADGESQSGVPRDHRPRGLAADAVDQSGSWFNTCAFVQPPAGQFGNAGRNILTGPGLRNLDFSLSRSIPLRGDKYHPQFRGEFFNMLDHPNFDIPNYVFGDPTFGEVLSANAYGNKPPRQIQLGLKYVF